MILRMLRRTSMAFALIFGLSASLWAQPSVVIESDLRLFTTMAALNAAGFDIELGSQYHPVREAVRKIAQDVDPDLVARLKDFYTRHKGSQSDDEQLAKYISLAVSLGDPPGFRLTTREEFVPPDARGVLGFADLLREFYLAARISQRWLEFRPQYEQTMAELGPSLRDLIVRVDSYLRIPLGNAYTRTLAIYVELAAPQNSVNVRSYQDNYYVVMGGGTLQKIDEVRHAYLHFHLDNLVARNIARFEGGSSLLGLVSKADGVDPAYTSEFHIMATESLIRAIELRLDKTPEAVAKERIAAAYRTGLLLAPRFYEALEIYEQREASFREHFAEMASKTDIKGEQLRFQQTFHKIPVPERTEARSEVPVAAPAAPANPVRSLLKEGEAALNSGDRQTARAAFEKVLAEHDRDHGAALYGLALIVSQEDDVEQAKMLFERTVQSTSAEPSMKVWAYIYLGRIYDLECSRERAISYYQQALKTGDNTNNAQAIAKDGSVKPYGESCRY